MKRKVCRKGDRERESLESGDWRPKREMNKVEKEYTESTD